MQGRLFVCNVSCAYTVAAESTSHSYGLIPTDHAHERSSPFKPGNILVYPDSVIFAMRFRASRVLKFNWTMMKGSAGVHFA